MLTGKCMICGRETRGISSSEVPVYCEEHRSYAERDDQILRDAPKEFYFALAMAIFTRARNDYIYNADDMRDDAERFLRSEWAQALSLSSFDPDDVIRGMDEVIENGL